jgi:hypothetical protein
MSEKGVAMAESNVLDDVQVTFLGRLPVGVDGPGRITSPLDTDGLEACGQKIEEAIMLVKNDKTACCGDGRCAVCVASDLNNGFNIDTYEEPREIEPMYQLFGGLYSAFSHAAVLANWSGFDSPSSFAEAKDHVSRFLDEAGYEDCAHTSTAKLHDASSTDCGFEMGFSDAERAVIEGDLGPVKDTVAALSGYQAYDDMKVQDKELIEEIIATMKEKCEDGGSFYSTYDPVANRDALKEKYGGNRLVILRAEDDPTHGHHEVELVVVTKMGVTVDQQKMALANNQVFVYHKAFAEELSKRLGGTERETRKLELAFDISSVVIAHGKLFAPGMPVSIVS